jgi:hypothetical protein
MAANTNGPTVPFPVFITSNLLFFLQDAEPTRRLKSAE